MGDKERKKAKVKRARGHVRFRLLLKVSLILYNSMPCPKQINRWYLIQTPDILPMMHVMHLPYSEDEVNSKGLSC